MDWQMKLMDGLTATREILKLYPEACIFLISQFDDEELRASAFDSGVRDFVAKDDLVRLRTIIRQPEIPNGDAGGDSLKTI